MIEIKVDGMTCTSCATHVKEALEKVPGVNKASVSYTESKAKVMANEGIDRGRMLAASAATDRNWTVVLLTLSFAIMDLMLPSAWALCLDIGGSHAGAVTGTMNMAGQFGGFVCTLVFGYVVKYFDSYNAPLVLIAGMLFLAAFLFSRIDAEKPLFPEIEGVQ